MASPDKTTPPAADTTSLSSSDESLLDLRQQPQPTISTYTDNPDQVVRPYYDDPEVAELVAATLTSDKSPLQAEQPKHPKYQENLLMTIEEENRRHSMYPGGKKPTKGSREKPRKMSAFEDLGRAGRRRASSIQLMLERVRNDLTGEYKPLKSEDTGGEPLLTSDQEASSSEDTSDSEELGFPAQLHPSEIQAIKRHRSTLVPQVFAALAVSVGSMLVGFTAAFTSPALASMQAPDSRLHITDSQASWIGSLMPLSALCGGVVSGTIIERLGRKVAIIGTALPFMVSYILIAFAQDVYMIYVARALAGLCIGILSLAMPVYLGETIQSDIRGTLGLLPTTIGNTGILVCFLVGSFLRWDHLAMFAGVLPIPFAIMMWFVPETPRWYITRGKMTEAARSMRWLRGADVSIADELSSITEHITAAQRSHTSYRDLFTGHHLRALAICLALMLFQQMSGINAVIFYSVSIFQIAGSTIDSNLCSVVVGVVNFGATFVATIVIDRLGRKVLLYISSSLMLVSLAILGGFFYVKDTMPEQEALVAQLGWLPLVSFMVFVVAFSVGWGPIPWLFLGEGLPSRIRDQAGSIGTAFNWSCTFLVTKTFSDLLHAIGAHGTFWLFGAFVAAGLVFTIAFMPETKGKSLEDIERHMSTKHGHTKKELISSDSV